MSNRALAPIRQEQNNSTLQVMAELDKRSDQFLALLGSEAAVKRFQTVAIHAVTSRPDLLRCDIMSLVESIREAATLDLEPTGSLGEAWLIPYKGMAKLRIGWQGYLKLIERSGAVTAVDCQVVYENDEFDLQLGTTPSIHHVPTHAARGSYKGAYAWARLLDGTYIIEWLPVADVEPIKKLAAADSQMWRDFPGEGMRKSAIRRLQKRLPKTPLVERALKVEAESEAPIESSPARSAATSALAARFGEGEQGEPGELTPSTEDGQPTAEQADPAVCNATPPQPDPLGMTLPCIEAPGHDGMHKSEEGSWPQK